MAAEACDNSNNAGARLLNAEKESELEMVRQLLKSGAACIKAFGKRRKTLLINAARADKLEIVQLLLKVIDRAKVHPASRPPLCRTRAKTTRTRVIRTR
jgi:ankyrin repeat protein